MNTDFAESWAAVVDSEPYQKARPLERLRAFEDWSTSARKQLEESGDTASIPEFEKFTEERRSRLRGKYDLAEIARRKYDEEEVSDSEMFKALKDREGLINFGFEPEQVDRVRENFFQMHKVAFDMSRGMKDSEADQVVPKNTAVDSGPDLSAVNRTMAVDDLDENQLREKFWNEAPGFSTSRILNTALVTVGLLPIKLVGAAASAADLAARMDPSYRPDESPVKAVADWARETKDTAMAGIPSDPRMSGTKQAIEGAAAQLPSQLATMFSTPANVARNYLEMMEDMKSTFAENRKKGLFNQQKEAGLIPAAMPFESWENGLTREDRDQIDGEATAQAMLVAVPAAGIESVAEIFGMSAKSLESIPGGVGKWIGKTLWGARAARPGLTKGALVAGSSVVKPAVEGVEETGQGVLQDATNALNSGEFSWNEFKQNAWTNFVGGATMGAGFAAVSTPATFRRETAVNWAREVIDGKNETQAKRTEILDAIAKDPSKGTDSIEYRMTKRMLDQTEDEAHWIASRVTNENVDKTRVERHEIFQKAKGDYDRLFSDFLAGEPNAADEIEAGRRAWTALQEKTAKIREVFRSNREQARANNLPNLAAQLDTAEAKLIEQAQTDAKEKIAKAERVFRKFRDGDGVDAAEARVRVADAFPEFRFAEQFKDDATVTAVSEALTSGQIKPRDDVNAWLASKVEAKRTNPDETKAKNEASAKPAPKVGAVQGSGSPAAATGAGAQSAQPAPAPEPKVFTVKRDGKSEPETWTTETFLQAYNSLYDKIGAPGVALTKENTTEEIENAKVLEDTIDKSEGLTDEEKTSLKEPVTATRRYLEQLRSEMAADDSVNPATGQSTNEAPAPAPTSIDQAVAEKTPFKLGSDFGVLGRTAEGRPVFIADNGTEIELRVNEDAVDKDPAQLVPTDYGTEAGPVTPAAPEGKKFSVLPARTAPAVRPVFVQPAPVSPNADTPPTNITPQQNVTAADLQRVSPEANSQTTQGGDPNNEEVQIRQAQEVDSPDLTAAEESVLFDTELHHRKDGRKRTASREAAAVLASKLRTGMTRTEVIALGKGYGFTSAKALAITESGASPSELLSGDFDADLGLFDLEAAPAPAADSTEEQSSKFFSDTDSGNWTNVAFEALRQASPEFARKLADPEFAAEVRKNLGGIYSKHVNAIVRDIFDKVVRDDTAERILYGDGTSQHVLGDLLENLRNNGDPFKVVQKRTGKLVPYSALKKYSYLKGRGVEEAVAGPARGGVDVSLLNAPEAPQTSNRNELQQVGHDILTEMSGGDELTYAFIADALTKKFGHVLGKDSAFEFVKPSLNNRANKAKWDALKLREGELLEDFIVRFRESVIAKGLRPSEGSVTGGEFTLFDLLIQDLSSDAALGNPEAAITAAREQGSLEPLQGLLETVNTDPQIQSALFRAIFNHLGVSPSQWGRLANDWQAFMREVAVQLTPERQAALLESSLLPPNLRSVLRAATEVSSTDDFLGSLLESKDTPEYAKLLALVFSEGSGPKVAARSNLSLIQNVVFGTARPRAMAQGFWNRGNEIFISPFLSSQERVAVGLHEFAHARLDPIIQAFDPKHPLHASLTQQQRDILEQADGLRLFVKTEAERLIAEAEARGEDTSAMRRDLLYGAENLDEFFNEALNHKPFQEFLASLTDPSGRAGQSVWRKVVNYIVSLMRGIDVKMDSALQRAFEQMIELAVPTTPGLDITQRNPIQVDFLRRAGAAGVGFDMAREAFNAAFPKEQAPQTISEVAQTIRSGGPMAAAPRVNKPASQLSNTNANELTADQYISQLRNKGTDPLFGGRTAIGRTSGRAIPDSTGYLERKSRVPDEIVFRAGRALEAYRQIDEVFISSRSTHEYVVAKLSSARGEAAGFEDIEALREEIPLVRRQDLLDQIDAKKLRPIGNGVSSEAFLLASDEAVYKIVKIKLLGRYMGPFPGRSDEDLDFRVNPLTSLTLGNVLESIDANNRIYGAAITEVTGITEQGDIILKQPLVEDLKGAVQPDSGAFNSARMAKLWQTPGKNPVTVAQTRDGRFVVNVDVHGNNLLWSRDYDTGDAVLVDTLAARYLTKDEVKILKKRKDELLSSKTAQNIKFAAPRDTGPKAAAPTTFGEDTRRTTQALRRIQDSDDPVFAPIQRALRDRSYPSETDQSALTRAARFIDENHAGDAKAAFYAVDSQQGRRVSESEDSLTAKEVVAVKGLAIQRALLGADAARIELAKLREQVKATPSPVVKDELYEKIQDLAAAEQRLSDDANVMALDVQESASIAGSGLQSYRMLADLLKPQQWVAQYKKTITKKQVKKLSKDPLVQRAMNGLRAAREAASSAVSDRVKEALAGFARRTIMPADTTNAEVEAIQALIRQTLSGRPVRDMVVQAASEAATIEGVETLRRFLTPEQQADPSILRTWEARLRTLAAEQINGILGSRLQGGQVDPEPPTPPTAEEQELAEEEKAKEAFRVLSDVPVAEIVFNLAKAQLLTANTPYAAVLENATFDAARSLAIHKAVKSVIKVSEEIRKTADQRGEVLEILKDHLIAANPSLSESELQELSGAIETYYNDTVQQASRAALERIAASADDPKASRVFDRKTIEDLMPLVNMGIFTNEDAYNVIAPKYGLPVWDAETSKALEAEATEMQRLPVGSLPRFEAAQKLGLSILKANIAAAKKTGLKDWGTYVDIVWGVWSASILSGPQTQLVNATASAANVFLMAVSQARGEYRALRAGGVDSKRASAVFRNIARGWQIAFGKTGENVTLRAIEESARALQQAQTRFKVEKMESSSVLEAFDFDPSIAGPARKSIEALVEGKWVEGATEGARTAWNFGLGGLSTFLLGPAALPVIKIENTLRGRKQAALETYAANMKLVGRVMQAVDAMNSEVANATILAMKQHALLLADPNLSDAEVARQMKAIEDGGMEDIVAAATATANDEEARGFFKGDKLAKSRRITQLIEESTFGAENTEIGRDFAAVATFNNDAYGMVGAVLDGMFQYAANATGGLTKPLNPFPRTLSNIVNSLIEYSPYGYVRASGFSLSKRTLGENSKYVRQAPAKGSADYYALRARATAGTVAVGVAALIAFLSYKERKEGRVPWIEITGPGPQEPNQRRQWLAAGNKPYTLRVGDKLFRYTDWPGFSMILGVVGTAHDQSAYADEMDTLVDRFVGSAFAIGTVTLSRNMLGGASAFFDALSQSTTDTQKQVAATRLAQSYVGGFTKPSFARWAETVVTGEYPDTRSFSGLMASMVPWAGPLRDQPALNVLGEPIKIPLLDATAGRIAAQQQPHPILMPLANANLWIRPPNAYPIADPSSKAGARRMTASERYDFQKFFGESMRARLTPGVVSSLTRMAGTNLEAAQERLNTLASLARAEAQNRVRAELQITKARK